MTKKLIKNLSGFTLTELLITITILVIVTGAVYGGYSLSQKAYSNGEASAEITQNGRVIIERMNREIRQAKEITGDFPEEEESAQNEIIFEDGHIETPYYYIHYFQSDGEIKREVLGYYFSGDITQTLVPWDAIPPVGQTLETKILEENKVIGEWVSNLELWGSKIININLILQKKDKVFNLKSEILGRNL